MIETDARPWVGYIRRSAGGESQMSEDAQRDAIASIASSHGATIERVYRDWNKSGWSKGRPEYAEVIERMEAGELGGVVVYDQDRASRRPSWYFGLIEAAMEQRGVVVDRNDRDLAGRDRLSGGVMALMDSEVLIKMTDRNRENAKRRRERGDHQGHVPFGHRRVWNEAEGRWINEPGWRRSERPDPTTRRYTYEPDPDELWRAPLDAYAKAGTANGAAILLNEQGIPSESGKTWASATVHRYVHAIAPELLPQRAGRAKRQRITRAFTGLIRCACGARMTPMSGRQWVCPMAARGLHDGPFHVADSRVVAWAKVEAARLIPPQRRVSMGGEASIASQRKAVIERRTRYARLWADGVIDDKEWASVQKDAAAKLAELAAQAKVDEVEVEQAVDWSWDAPALNRVLTAMWERITIEVIDGRMVPVSAIWRRPSWRR